MKEEFIELLRSTNREGMDKVIAKLEKMGFFTAPASSKNHLCREGGLVEHSLNVYKMAKMIHGQLQLSNPEIKIKEESVIIASLLHDVCKADIYKIGVKWRKDDQGRWEQ
jgi:23S rRNA maturation-related 3'-5' exoribonuclease YhaM